MKSLSSQEETLICFVKMERTVGPEGPLLVIGAGIGRTGTKSLKIALEQLYGQPCYHMHEVTDKHRNHIVKWLELYTFTERNPGKSLPREKLKDIFKGYRCATDHPACAVYKQLMQIYPDAKVILTVRDKHKWLQSVRAAFLPEKMSAIQSIRRKMLMTLGISWNFGQLAKKTLQLTLGHDCDVVSDTKLMEAFDKWNNQVKREVPPEKLLVYDVSQGWEPLCQFLNLPVPQIEFPHVNDRESLLKRMEKWERQNFILFWVATILIGFFLSSVGYLALPWLFQ